MSGPTFARALTAGAAAAAIATLSAPACAQDADSAGRTRTWAELAELPDLTTGIWEITFGAGGFGGGAEIMRTPEYEAKAEAYRAQGLEDTPAANCVPPGMPGIMNQPYPMQFLFGPSEVAIHIEAYEQVRHIYTDGRPLPENPDPTFNGASVGHWEGDTLVVETAGFVDFTPLGDVWEVAHSEQMRITERMRLTDTDTLEIVTTVEDPAALAEPYVTTRSFARHPDWTIAEYVCEENNRNVFLPSGEADIVMTPPDGVEP